MLSVLLIGYLPCLFRGFLNLVCKFSQLISPYVRAVISPWLKSSFSLLHYYTRKLKLVKIVLIDV